MKKYIIISTLVFTMSVLSAAQSVPSLVIGSDPVAFGVANATMAREADAFAIENNASMMAFSEKKMQISASYGIWSPSHVDNTIVSIGGFSTLGENLAVGFTGKYIKDKPYNLVGENGVATGTYSPKDIVATAGISYRVAPSFSIGFSAKIISSDIGASMKGFAFGADLSAAYSKDNFSASAGIANFGSKISYGKDSYDLPSLAKAGLAYRLLGLSATVQANYYFSGALSAAAGLEYNIADIVILRAGYHYGDKEGRTIPSYASAGLGLKRDKLVLDAAFLFGSQILKSSIILGLGYSF